MSGVIKLFASLALLCCLSGLALSQPKLPTPEEKREAEKAWEALIRTKGGREKLYSITNMLTEYANMTTLYGFPNSEWYFAYNIDGKTPSLVIADGSKSIQYYCSPKGLASIAYENLTGAFDTEQLTFLLETKWYKPEVLRVIREKEGRKEIDVIETIIGKQRVDFVYESEELLVSEVRFYYKGNIWRKYRFSDYTDIDGIKMPTKIAYGFDVEKYAHLNHSIPIMFMLNVDYDPEIFTKPQRATTPDAWKAKKPTPLPMP